MPDPDKSATDTSAVDTSATESSGADAGASPELFTLARQALLDITTADSIGDPSGSITEEDNVVTLYFATTAVAYSGWRWTVSIAQVADLEPSVLETELTPGDGALLSPDWVPWVDRLADYKEAQAALAAELAEAGVADADADDADDDDADDDFDEDDVNDDDEALLHSGDLDGVDIDVLDEIDDDEDAVGEDAVGSDDSAKAVPAAKSGSVSASTRRKKTDQPKDESGDAGPQQPKKSRRAQSGQTAKAAKDDQPAKTGGRAKKQQDDDQGDQPEG